VSLKRQGCERPRVFTPPLRELTPESSLGFAVVDFAAEVLEIELYPWQKWLLVHALELLPDGSFRFRTVVVLVARQNGKSTLSQILALFFMFVLGVSLVLGTAQDLDVAEEIWQGAVDLVEETPELNAQKSTIVKAAGKKALVLKSGERYKVKSANRRAGRGLSGDLILLDELREHQSWDAWGAITKTTMARPDAQVWALSNAGDVSSIVLRYLRKMAHAAVGDPDGICADDVAVPVVEDDDESADVEMDEDSLGIFEWSAPPGCGVWDRDGWAQANPSLGFSITERTVGSAAKTDPEWVFRTEVLCQWSDGNLDSVFPPGSWDAGVDAASRWAEGSPVTVCVDVSASRGMAYAAVAGRRADGRLHVEVAMARAGTDWVVEWLTDPKRPRWAGVTLQSSGAPVSSLLEQVESAKHHGKPLPFKPWGGPDLGRAHGDFYDMVVRGELAHRPQPPLDVAVRTAVKRSLGDGAWAFDRRRSPRDCAPLIAAVGAVWLLQSRPDETKRPHVHEWPAELLAAR
jgi:phage terminase large subunit-like protein